jgi:acetolactate synthase-1/2/3 large subunit
MFDSSAVLAITGNVPTSQFNRGPFQESGRYFQGDFPNVIRHYVKRSYQAVRPEMLPLMLSQAFSLMTAGRPGPVNLDVPLNVFVEDVGDADGEGWEPAPVTAPAPAPAAVRKVAELLADAERPVILAGNGAMSPSARAQVAQLASALRIPVITTPMGKGVIDETSDLCLGPIGRNGTFAANKAGREADVLLALGTRFDDRATSSWIPGVTFSIPPTRLIHVDIDPQEIGRNYPTDLGIVADAGEFSAQLIAAAAAGPAEQAGPRRESWLAQTRAWKSQWARDIAARQADSGVPIKPDRLVAELQRALPDNANLLADVGVHHNWVLQQIAAPPNGRLLQAWGFAAMGFGVGGVIGAKLAEPAKPAVTVCGDGCFLMHANAVATAVELDVPAVWVVWNNTGYGSIRGQQATFFGRDREIATRFRSAATGDLYSTDIAGIARAMGADGARIDDPGDVADAVEAAIKSDRPTVLDVRVDNDVAAPGTGSWDLPPLSGPVPDYGW